MIKTVPRWLRSLAPLVTGKVGKLSALLRHIAEGKRRGCQTVQELLRHANSRITLDVYTQAVNSNKRAAQSKVVRMIVSIVGQKVEEKYPGSKAVAGILDLYRTLIWLSL